MTNTTLASILGLGLALALAACGDNAVANLVSVDGPPRMATAVVVAGDFVAGHPGVLSTLDPIARTVMKNVGPAMAVGDDPILRHIGNELFIINRADGNNITIVNDQTLALVEQLGTGPSSNPQDVAVVGSKLYIPTFGTAGVTVMTRGQITATTIDLSADDPDGKPNCESAISVGADIYVACGLLDDTMPFFPPRGPGKVYVIDSATDKVRATLTLHNVNPFGAFEEIPVGAPGNGELLIPTVSFADGSGCVERIVPGPTPTAPACLISNAALGGYASRVSFQLDSTGWMLLASVPSSDFVHQDLRRYNLASNTLQAAPVNPSAEVIGDAETCPTGQLVVSDTTMNANGLRVYEGTVERTTAALPIGLRPTSTRGIVCY
jgi:hypothetical protein